MTAICGGGTSSPRAGFGASLALTASSIAALLNNIPTIWAVPLAGYLGLLTYNLSEFCSTDPPDVPDITAEDVINIISIANPLAHQQSLQKLADLVGAYAWYSVCKCDSVATPAPPTAPDPPDGMPDINPPSVAPYYPTGTPCQTFEYGGLFSDNPGITYPLVPIGQITYGRVDFTASRTTLTTGQFGFNVRWYNASMAQIVGPETLIVGIDTATVYALDQSAIPAGTAYFQIGWGDGPSATPDFEWHATVRMYCGTEPGNPSGPVPTPCPPDPIVQAMLNQILELVTLIQRQQVPFSTITGAAHSGLTLGGSISVQGLIGARVDLTALPSSVGAGPDGNSVWNAGWVRWANASGASVTEWIGADPFVSFPAAAGQWTQIQYWFSPGVTATITELQREP